MVAKSNSERIRCSREFKTFIREAQLDYIRKGKKPPTDAEMTKMISKKIKKEDIMYDGFIQF